MFTHVEVITLTIGYSLILFMIAIWGEKISSRKVSLLNNAFIYSLSLSVYCTSWTFYGSVGMAMDHGFLFLGIYLGPTLMTITWWVVLRKLIRIKNKFNITSIVDFISARYDKSEGLGILTGSFLFVGLIPYIAIQLKVINKTIEIITANAGNQNEYELLIAGLMCFSTIFFGLRKLNTTHRHPGMVLAVAFEGVVKLLAFIAVGVFVCYYLYSGIDDIFSRIPRMPGPMDFLGAKGSVNSITWITFILISAPAVILLPRQFHISVVENNDENHLKKAKWVFPLYLLLINFFVLPIAIGGKFVGLPRESADYFVLILSQIEDHKIFTAIVFLGGFSAAMGMIMIETITLSTIFTNHIALPIFSRVKMFSFMNKHILKQRRVVATFLILISYVYMKTVSDKFGLISIGTISFVAVLQLAPTVFGALYWEKGSKAGAFAAVTSGFILWFYTLVIPSLVTLDWVSKNFLNDGPFHIEALKPEALFGFSDFHPLTNSLVWSMLANVGSYIFFSIVFPPKESEQKIASDFYHAIPDEKLEDIFLDETHDVIFLREKKEIFQKTLLLFFSMEQTNAIIDNTLEEIHILGKEKISILKLAELYEYIEKVLAGSIGTAAAHYALESASILNEDENKLLSKTYSDLLAAMKINPSDFKKQILLFQEKERLMKKEALLLEEQIRKKTIELEEQKNLTFQASKMSALGEMASGIAHEINNPLTIISAAVRGLRKMYERNEPDRSKVFKYLDDADKTVFRISNIIKGLLAVSRDASNEEFYPVKVRDIFNDVLSLCSEKFKANGVEIRINLEDEAFDTIIECKKIQISQVFLNLLNNSYDAIEKLPEKWIEIAARVSDDHLILRFIDSGTGIPLQIKDKIFQPFFTTKEVGKGTGLGLSLSNTIINNHHGSIYVDSEVPNTCFIVTLPFTHLF